MYIDMLIHLDRRGHVLAGIYASGDGEGVLYIT